MASRRLAISSLLCADDSDTPVAGPSRHSPPDYVSAAQTNAYNRSSTPLGSSPRPSSTSPLTGVMIPMSTQPTSYIGGRTPSPASHFAHAPSTPSTSASIPRRSYKEIAFDDYTTHAASVTSPSANRPAANLQDYHLRRQLPQPPRPTLPQSPSTTSYHLQERADPYSVSECWYSSLPLRPTGQTDLVLSTHLAQPTSFVSSPSRSPIIPYASSHRQTSRSPINPRQGPHFDQPQSPRRSYRPSLSPVQVLSQPPPVSSSPAFASPPLPHQTTPQHPTYRSPTQSRHAISSLLTASPPVSPPTTRASAASLPHILNSPVAPKSTTLDSPSGNTMGSLGMEGLEALVQAATQERERLNEEMIEDTMQASFSPRNALLHVQQSPLTAPVERSVPSSPLIGKDAPFDTRPSPQGLSDARSQHEQRGAPISLQLQFPSSSTQALTPFSESAVATSSPLALASMSRRSSRATRPSDLIADGVETLSPPPKRRRSSERSLQSALPDPLSPTPTPYFPLTDIPTQVKAEVIPLIGPGVAPPLDKTRIPVRFVGATSGTVAEPELSPTRGVVSSTSVPPTPTLAFASSPLVPASPDIDNANMQATSLSTNLLSVASNDAPPSVAQLKVKTRRKRPEGRDAGKPKGKERLAERRTQVSLRTSDSTTESQSGLHLQQNLVARDDDTDDWFREQFGESPATKSLDALSVTPASNEIATCPDPSVSRSKKSSRPSPPSHRTIASSKKSPQDRSSRSPTPLAMLEAELEGVVTTTTRPPSPLLPLVEPKSASPSPCRKLDSPPPTDVDLDTELERAIAGEAEPSIPPVPKQKPRPRPRPRPKVKAEDAAQLDVEDELLALLDGGDSGEKDKKHRANHVQPPAPAKDDNSAPATSFDSAGPSEHRGRKKHSSKATKASAPGSTVSSPALGGSSAMPPPASRDVSQVRDHSISRVTRDDYEPSTVTLTPAAGTPSTTPVPTPVLGATSKGKEGPAPKVRRVTIFKSRVANVSLEEGPGEAEG